MRYSPRLVGGIVTVALGAALLGAVVYGGPEADAPVRSDRRRSPEQRSRAARREGERPVRREREGAVGADCTKTSVGLTPLNELGGRTYKGFAGGLYEGGENVPPSDHEAAAIALARGIEPLNSDGAPDSEGNYALLSIGMSNTQTEFIEFKQLAESDSDRDDRLVIVNGAQGGAIASEWSNPTDRTWQIVDQQLASSGVSHEQVAIAWVKVADQIKASEDPPSWPDHAEELSADMAAIMRILKDRYPNLRLAYLSSRIYGAYGADNTEPFAYESGFSVKWVVEAQIDGSPELNFDPDEGSVEAPWIGWGPYLWADGVVARADGLEWKCSDFQFDGTHPTKDGTAKVAELLLDFFHSDPSAREWYLEDGGAP